MISFESLSTQPFNAISTLCLGILLIVFSGCSQEEGPFTWKELDAPGGKLHIGYLEPPAYGRHILHFTYYASGDSVGQSVGVTQLNNDGANLGDHNIEVFNLKSDSTLMFILYGQQDEEQRFYVKVEKGEAKLVDRN